ncbi:MAG: hypothetical protein LLG16_03360 [Euryarchaeota archaeon]|nr:hypothetical protein [Euryarchaeota archaeon]
MKEGILLAISLVTLFIGLPLKTFNSDTMSYFALVGSIFLSVTSMYSVLTAKLLNAKIISGISLVFGLTAIGIDLAYWDA